MESVLSLPCHPCATAIQQVTCARVSPQLSPWLQSVALVAPARVTLGPLLGEAAHADATTCPAKESSGILCLLCSCITENPSEDFLTRCPGELDRPHSKSPAGLRGQQGWALPLGSWQQPLGAKYPEHLLEWALHLPGSYLVGRKGCEEPSQPYKVLRKALLFSLNHKHTWPLPPNSTFPLAVVVLMTGSLEPSFNYKHCLPSTRQCWGMDEGELPEAG